LQKLKHIKVLVGIPHTQMIHVDFAISLMNLLLACEKYRIQDYKDQTVTTMWSGGSMLPKQRWEITKEAVRVGADYLLFIDSDHKFPRKLLHALIEHGKDVVAVNCVTKNIPASTTARLKPTPQHPSGVPVFSDPEKTGLEQVWRVGTGVMLLNCRVFQKIGTRVWDMFFNEAAGAYQGEDWTLCTKLEEAGIPIYVDHDLSREVTHIGHYHFTHDVVGEVKYVADPEPSPTGQAVPAA
jgi:hypothetical protein